MVKPQPSKLDTWVRFPSSAPDAKIIIILFFKNTYFSKTIVANDCYQRLLSKIIKNAAHWLHIAPLGHPTVVRQPPPPLHSQQSLAFPKCLPAFDLSLVSIRLFRLFRWRATLCAPEPKHNQSPSHTKYLCNKISICHLSSIICHPHPPLPFPFVGLLLGRGGLFDVEKTTQLYCDQSNISLDLDLS